MSARAGPTTQGGGAARSSRFRTRGDAADEGSDGDGDYQPAGRLERVAIAATKQSLRPHGLRLSPPTALPQLLQTLRQQRRPAPPQAAGAAADEQQQRLPAAPLGLVAVAGAPPLGSVLRELQGGYEVQEGAPPPNGTGGGGGGSDLRLLLVGPEGDFTPGELEALVGGAGCRAVGLGANRLRTETAAIGLLAACLLAGPA